MQDGKVQARLLDNFFLKMLFTNNCTSICDETIPSILAFYQVAPAYFGRTFSWKLEKVNLRFGSMTFVFKVIASWYSTLPSTASRTHFLSFKAVFRVHSAFEF